jgi:hypothetical protein
VARIVTDYFAAPSDDVAAVVLAEAGGPSTPSRGSGEPLFDTVPLPSIEPFVMLGTLHALLSGRPYRECTAEQRHGQVVGGGDEGPWVVTLSDGLVRELATAPQPRLAAATARWVRSPELRQLARPQEAERMREAIAALAALAERAVDVRHTLYCWTSLAG